MAASAMVSVVVVVAMVAATLLQPMVEAAAEQAGASPLLRFPGTRQRSPGFAGYPGARSSPSSARGFPLLPGARPSPPSAPAGLPGATRPSGSPVPSSSASQPQPACPRPAEPLPGFPGMPGAGSPSSPTECVAPLAGLMSCASFLTGSEQNTPTPQGDCCSGLGAFLNSSSSAAAEQDRSLRCLCPVILGDVNRVIPKPIDPVRMLYLPIACGLVLPPQVLFICFTGQPTPPVVTRIPESWTTAATSSALSP